MSENRMKDTNGQEKIILDTNWIAPVISDVNTIPKGDMPGDKIKIDEQHIAKAQRIFPKLLELLLPILNDSPSQKAVISVHGGSGVGKSEIGSILAFYLNNLNIGSYILSGDNYPHRIPKYNDAERLRTYREHAIKGLVAKGEFTKECNEILQHLQDLDKDSDPEGVKEYPWLAVYQEAGRNGLKNYLGTPNEIDFDEVSDIIAKFKAKAPELLLKRMGREEKELWYDAIDVSNIKVLVIEWTHGNNSNLKGVDIPILLNSTPQETLEHRKARNRDGAADSAFTTMVLNIEQGLLASQAPKAKLIVTKNGELVSFEEYSKLMEKE